jgi:hypothetical protein
MNTNASFSFFLGKPAAFRKFGGFAIAFLVVWVVFSCFGCMSNQAKKKPMDVHQRLSSQQELSDYARNYRKSVEGNDEVKSTGSLFFPSARAREIDKNLGGMR